MCVCVCCSEPWPPWEVIIINIIRKRKKANSYLRLLQLLPCLTRVTFLLSLVFYVDVIVRLGGSCICAMWPLSFLTLLAEGALCSRAWTCWQRTAEHFRWLLCFEGGLVSVNSRSNSCQYQQSEYDWSGDCTSKIKLLPFTKWEDNKLKAKWCHSDIELYLWQQQYSLIDQNDVRAFKAFKLNLQSN